MIINFDNQDAVGVEGTVTGPENIWEGAPDSAVYTENTATISLIFERPVTVLEMDIVAENTEIAVSVIPAEGTDVSEEVPYTVV